MPSEPLRPHLSMPRVAAACAAVVVAAITVAGCGGSDTPSAPSGQGGSTAAVARVADQEITRAQFERALHARVTGISPLSPGSAGVPLDTPRFRRCAAAAARQLRAAGTAHPPARSVLVRNCAAQYQQARMQTMSALIQQEWIVQQAKASGVEVPEAQVAAALKGYQRAAGYKRRLARSGLTQADVRAVIEAQLLSAQLTRPGAIAMTPTKTQLKTFVKEHPSLFGSAAQRTIDLVAAPTAAQADAARAALKKGKSAADIAAGLPTAGRVRQGRFTVTDGDGQLGAPLNADVFAARTGRIVGPVKVGQLYYVAVVRSARAAQVPPYAQVAAQARQQLLSQRVQQAQIAFQAKLTKTWRPKTACAKGYIVPECGNAAAATTTTTATTS